MDVKLSLLVLIFWSISLVQFPFVITTVKGQKVRHCFSNGGSPTTAEPPPQPSVSSSSNHQNKVHAASTTVLEMGKHHSGGGGGGRGNSKNSTVSSPLAEFGAGDAGVLVVVEDGDKKKKCCKQLRTKALDLRVWGILTTILLQDLPFWLLRIYLIFWEHVSSYTMFFFLCKNALIMWIQVYRIFVICCERPGGRRNKKKESAEQQQQHQNNQRNNVVDRRSASPQKDSSTRSSPPRYQQLLYPSFGDVKNGGGEKATMVINEQEQPAEANKPKDTKVQNGLVTHHQRKEAEEESPPAGLPIQQQQPRPSLHITGTVDARDILLPTSGANIHSKGAAVEEKRRNAASAMINQLPNPFSAAVAKHRKRQKNAVAAAERAKLQQQQQQIRLATPDDISDDVSSVMAV